MAKLIRDDMLIAEISKELFMTDSTKAAFRSIIHKTPAVDAVEVVHGWWVCLESEIGYFACSKCDHRILRAKCNYCPNCGARMDAERKSNGED